MKNYILLSSLVWLCCQALLAQSDRSIHIGPINGSIKIDGVLDEPIWSTADPADDFWQYFPSDSVKADQQTEIRMAYDDDKLYVAITCHSIGDQYTVPSLKRDYRAGGSDNITLLIDPFNDGINAYMFGINPRGVRREGLISGGGVSLDGFSNSWDQKWTGEAKTYPDKWTAEIAIPFSILRFNAGNKTWRFSTYRFDMQANERSNWIRVPRNQWVFNLGYMGEMRFEEAPKEQGAVMTFIPYAISSVSKDYEADTDADLDYNIGGDAKISITSGLNLDLTINPDFSQVEVDRQVTNLDRFEIFFPERRQFFLENADLFGSFGFRNINPFFSRRIGIAKDTTTGNAIQNTIYGGLRLSGKLNEDWRLGILNMQTADDEANGQPSLNFGVVALQRRIGARSNIGIIGVNRQSVQADAETSSIDSYNRTLGIDYNLATANNRWTGKTFLHRSFAVDEGDSPYAHGLRLNYNKRAYELSWQHEYVGEGYDSQVGFVRRTDYKRINPRASLFFYPQESKFNRIELVGSMQQIWKPGYGSTDQTFRLRLNSSMLNNSRWDANLVRQYVYLFGDFDPTGTGQEKLAADTEYSYYFFEGGYNSDWSKNFTYRINPFIGQYFNGYRYGVRGEVKYRAQPWGQFTLNYGYNIFDMPHLDTNPQTFLLGPTIDLTFSKSLFFTTYIQYNSQIDNTNVNMRLQWRFAPVSDFYLVFADNYFSGDIQPEDRFLFNVRNRSLVAKVTYWLNR